MKLFVNDTNILIDLADLNLLDNFTSIDAEFHTTDFIIAELEDSAQREKIEKLITENALGINVIVIL